ncbi:hypothetical protein ACQKOI_26920 [Bacillus paramycoides]|uniref:hypothetical protein n=1 Tax=Bacillus paramycoides TaxID=2026194 RepID=UPI003D069094
MFKKNILIGGPPHYFNACMKFLKNNGIGLDPKERVEFKVITDKVFKFSVDFVEDIYRFGVFTHPPKRGMGKNTK